MSAMTTSLLSIFCVSSIIGSMPGHGYLYPAFSIVQRRSWNRWPVERNSIYRKSYSSRILKSVDSSSSSSSSSSSVGVGVTNTLVDSNDPTSDGSTRSSKVLSDYLSSITTRSPWNNTLAVITDDKTVRLHSTQFRLSTKFRQHVNPLQGKFQLPCDLPSTWPKNAYNNCDMPLYLDIGCGKGGFLLELANTNYTTTTTSVDHLHSDFNLLGIEIRPSVVEYAQTRVAKRHLSGKLSFVGCNVNVDLDRLLHLYEQEAAQTRIKHHQPLSYNNVDANAKQQRLVAFVSIQFPDPHFKKRHKKRAVVDDKLVQTLAKYTTLTDAVVFLQSDIKDVLDEMRQSFLHHGSDYFIDTVDSLEEYVPENPIGVPTEREISVLVNHLPVYRCLFRRNNVPFSSSVS